MTRLEVQRELQRVRDIPDPTKTLIGVQRMRESLQPRWRLHRHLRRQVIQSRRRQRQISRKCHRRQVESPFGQTHQMQQERQEAK